MTDIRPIKTKADYGAALDEIAALMDARPNTPEGDRLEVLATLVEAHEVRHFPIEAPHPIDAILFLMEQMGLTLKDLEPAIGSRGRVSEILAGVRPLTLPMIRRLSKALNILAEVLIRDPRTGSRHERDAARPINKKPRLGGRSGADRLNIFQY